MTDARSPETAPRPLVVHVVYRFDTGGLENGVVNLINRMTDWQHAVIAPARAMPAFCACVQRDDVQFHSLHQAPGYGFHCGPALARILRELRPRVMYTRNLAARGRRGLAGVIAGA
jgi:hypothetical protein